MKLNVLILCLGLLGCTQYTSPERTTWDYYLNGASFMDMTETTKVAKRPVYLGSGGRLLSVKDSSKNLEYGDKNINDNTIATHYMAHLESDLYDSLRTYGESVERAGTDVVTILVRGAIMKPDVAEISSGGDDILSTIAQLLQKYDSTYLEIAGYTDAMRDTNAARAMSLDMAERVGVFLSRYGVKPARMFIVGRGSARPIAAQDGIGRLTNRRVEIRIAPAR